MQHAASICRQNGRRLFEQDVSRVEPLGHIHNRDSRRRISRLDRRLDPLGATLATLSIGGLILGLSTGETEAMLLMMQVPRVVRVRRILMPWIWTLQRIWT